MLFGKRKQVVKRILIVEDEPLTAFDNENMLRDAGYEIVATVDDFNEALRDTRPRRGATLSSATSGFAASKAESILPSTRAEARRPDLVRDGPCLSRVPRRSPSAACSSPTPNDSCSRPSNASTGTSRARQVKPPKGFELFVIARRGGVATAIHRGARHVVKAV